MGEAEGDELDGFTTSPPCSVKKLNKFHTMRELEFVNKMRDINGSYFVPGTV
jgi:hypothetical protein